MDGNLIHKDSEEAKRQLTTKRDAQGKSKDKIWIVFIIKIYYLLTILKDSTTDSSDGPKLETEASTAGKEDEEEDGGKSKGAGEKQLKNQFNYSDRASQSYNNPMRERSTMTEPPPRINFASNATQWEIYDAYVEDFEAQQKNKETKKATKTVEKKTKKSNQSEQVNIYNLNHVSIRIKIYFLFIIIFSLMMY